MSFVFIDMASMTFSVKILLILLILSELPWSFGDNRRQRARFIKLHFAGFF